MAATAPKSAAAVAEDAAAAQKSARFDAAFYTRADAEDTAGAAAAAAAAAGGKAGWTKLFQASYSGATLAENDELFKLEAKKLPLLWRATWGGNTTVFEEELQIVKDVRAVGGPLNSTALHEAVTAESLWMTGRLLAHPSVEIDALDDLGHTPFFRSVHLRRETELSNLLLEKGAQIDAVDLDGSTPLMASVELDDVLYAQWLVENKADVNFKNKDGEKPLHFATSRSMVDLLKRAGAA
jgi:ankyrin repeat protein